MYYYTNVFILEEIQFYKLFLQISFFSTSPELSNKQRFEYFSRTIPSDHYQTMAMAKIVERLGWKYMSIIYEESNYGIKVKVIDQVSGIPSILKLSNNIYYIQKTIFFTFPVKVENVPVIVKRPDKLSEHLLMP